MMVIEGRGFHRGSLQPLALGIEDGVIREIRKTLRGEERHDFGDRLLLPGGVDVHVHFRDPGLTHKEDFSTGTGAAAVGGITTILDMPNTVPPGTTAAALRAKRERVARKAHVDFGFFGGIEAVDEVEALAGASHALKVYLAESFGRPGLPPSEAARLLAALGEEGPRVTVHAEDPDALRPREERSLADHARARPDEAEVAAIRRLATGPQPRLHVAHLSSRRGLAALEGTRLTSEVTPMHLLHDATGDLGARGKINPPLRTPQDRETLWAAFVSGRIPVLASDHAPHTMEEKAAFPAAPPGAPNVETTYPLMLRLVKEGSLSLGVLLDALCRRPARLFGLPGKGALRIGGDADVVVVDPGEVRRVRGERLHTKCGWSPFEGWEAIFPRAVFLRGTLVAEEGELVAPRMGQWLPRKQGV